MFKMTYLLTRRQLQKIFQIDQFCQFPNHYMMRVHLRNRMANHSPVLDCFFDNFHIHFGLRNHCRYSPEICFSLQKKIIKNEKKEQKPSFKMCVCVCVTFNYIPESLLNKLSKSPLICLIEPSEWKWIRICIIIKDNKNEL